MKRVLEYYNPFSLFSVIRSSNVAVRFQSCGDSLPYSGTYLLNRMVGHIACRVKSCNVGLLANVNFNVAMLVGFYTAGLGYLAVGCFAHLHKNCINWEF